MANRRKNVNNVVEKEVKVENAVVNKMYSEEYVKELLNEMSVATLLSNEDFMAGCFDGLNVEELKEKVKNYIKNRVKEIEELQKEKDALKKQVEELKQVNNNTNEEEIIFGFEPNRYQEYCFENSDKIVNFNSSLEEKLNKIKIANNIQHLFIKLNKQEKRDITSYNSKNYILCGLIDINKIK